LNMLPCPIRGRIQSDPCGRVAARQQKTRIIGAHRLDFDETGRTRVELLAKTL
jgi:hypothetical protein